MLSKWYFVYNFSFFHWLTWLCGQTKHSQELFYLTEGFKKKCLRDEQN